MPADNACVTIPGPWEHRLVRASGAQFHVALCGEIESDTPLLLFVHGFPEYWYAWRHQLPAIGGLPVAAMDLRGAGGSDRTRQSFDGPTLARDITGVVRSLGATSVILVGHGHGAGLCWAAAALEPGLVTGVITLSAPHPADTYKLGFHVTFRTWRHSLTAFVPTLAEKAIQREDVIARLLREFSAPKNTGAVEAAEVYAQAMQLPNAASCQVDQLRWAWRTPRRLSGRYFLDQIDAILDIPVLTIRGGLDPLLPDRAWAQTHTHISGPYRHVVIPEAGHYPHEETPERVTELIRDYLSAHHGIASRKAAA